MGSPGQFGGPTLLSTLPGYHRPFFAPPAPLVIAPTQDYREKSMPESPSEAKTALLQPSTTSPVSPLVTMPPVSSSNMARPHSTSSSMSGVNGLHSPHNSVTGGRTPSPPGLPGAPASSQQLPPACGARQLSKLKRFLTTLIQFGSDISPDIGERVRSLVLALVNNHLSIEEFHAKLQEATNFPLRPFVIPFLKANLPLLQRELLHCARMAKQTPQQYLAHNEHVLFDPAHSPLDPAGSDAASLGSSSAAAAAAAAAELNENGKRRSPDRPKENGDGDVHPAKRPHTLSPVGSNASGAGSGGPGSRVSTPGHFHSPPPASSSGAPPMRLEDISLQREMRERMEREQRGADHRFPNFPNFPRAESTPNYDRHIDTHIDRIEDEWKHVENMLHCIMDMVGRCRRALTALQEKAQRDREELALWMRRHGSGLDSDMKKRADLMADSLRHTEDRVNEVRRRAVYDFPEEAVAEVKRQAVSELQKAVAAAETKAAELVAAERAKMDAKIHAARKEAQEEAAARLNAQEESSESCWNCGRKANETCSGCNVARYCGSFCQHKDWESHHRVCASRTPATAAPAAAALAGSNSSALSSSTTSSSAPTAPVPALDSTVSGAVAPTSGTSDTGNSPSAGAVSPRSGASSPAEASPSAREDGEAAPAPQ